MNPTMRTLLVVLALFAVVALAAILYSRGVGVSEPAPDSASPGSAQPDLRPEILAGQEAFAADHLEEAKAQFAKVPPTDPGYLVALRNLGLVHTKLEEYDAAVAAFTQLGALEPGIPQTHMELAWVLYQADRFVEAELSALRAAEIDNTDPESRYAVGLFRVAQGELGAAIDAYHRVIERDGDRERVAEALQDLLRLRSRHPEIAGVHYAVAFFAKTLNQRELEVEELEAYLDMKPLGPTVGLAEARLEEAQKALRK